MGWFADRKVPTFLRGFVYRSYSRITGADPSEARGPLEIYPSLGAFFIRELVPGARPIDDAPHALVSPVDGAVQIVNPITDTGRTLQAKGREYALDDFLAGIGDDIDWRGGHQWTLYLSPRDYHRIHAPEACTLTEVRFVRGHLFSVQPKVMAKRAVLDVNERAVLRLETERGPLLLILVGALNVGRIRVTGVPRDHDGPLAKPRTVERGGELARFELGSTIVLVAPPGGPTPKDLSHGDKVRLGESIGSWPA
jgi:phosphatidylserine decarboxylase